MEKEKIKKPFYKKWWFWLIAVLVLFIAIGASQDGDSEVTVATTTSSNTEQNEVSNAPKTNNEKITQGQKNAVRAAKNYLQIMGLSKKGLIHQLEFEGYSTEDAEYAAENCNADWKKNAAKSAKNYLNTMAFSRAGLIKQLEFEGYTQEEAEYGATEAGY